MTPLESPPASASLAVAASATNATPQRIDSAPLMPRPWLAAGMLCWREIIRFFRQRNRVIGALLQPVLFWVLFGVGLGRSFSLSAAGETAGSFTEYFFPGSLALIVLFTAIFATISIIEDRREGFLQAVLVAPIPRWSMLLGKVLGGTLIALAEGLIFLLLALTIGIAFGPLTFLSIAALLFVTGFGLTSLGVVIAWRMESTQGFHAIMNLLLMPMWLLSGAFFPIPAWSGDLSLGEKVMHAAMVANPMTYCVAGLRRLLYLEMPYPPALAGGDQFWVPSLAACWIGAGLLAVATFLLAWRVTRGRTQGDLH